jgi:hypothetical protein
MTTQRQEQIEREVTLLRGIAESTDARLGNILEVSRETNLRLQVMDGKLGQLLDVLQSSDARLVNILEVCQSTQTDIKVGNQAILEVLQDISRKLENP